MNKIISKLFSDYLSEQNITNNPEYSKLSKQALKKEQELRAKLNEEQTYIFEELFEITSQIHFMEVKDAFASACKLGAKASRELLI